MKATSRLLAITLLLCHTLPVAGGTRYWLDGISLTAGESDDSDGTEVLRVGFQKRWRHSWFDSGAWYLGGYWDSELAFIQVDRGSSDDAYALSITPVLRYQRDARLSSGVTPFAEAGLGLHLLSETRVGSNDLTTALQFGSLVGVGLGFGERGQYELTYRFTHISNGDIKKPNDGLDLHLLKLGYNFD